MVVDNIISISPGHSIPSPQDLPGVAQLASSTAVFSWLLWASDEITFCYVKERTELARWRAGVPGQGGQEFLGNSLWKGW